ncbi:MAG: hypothetical protein RBU30_05830 [Polyangia bacterium]|nr:hypothetical protein [Polyangia bacterium]
MGDPKLFLHELEILVNQQVQYVLGMAARCPAEGDPEWSRVLQRYKVQECSANEREGAVRRAGLSRGAPAGEVQAVLEAIQALALPALAHIEQQFRETLSRNMLLGAWVGRIRQRLEQLPQLALKPAEERPRDLFHPSWPMAAAI